MYACLNLNNSVLGNCKSGYSFGKKIYIKVVDSRKENISETRKSTKLDLLPRWLNGWAVLVNFSLLLSSSPLSLCFAFLPPPDSSFSLNSQHDVVHPIIFIPYLLRASYLCSHKRCMPRIFPWVMLEVVKNFGSSRGCMLNLGSL